jgi:hypothetical protein
MVKTSAIYRLFPIYRLGKKKTTENKQSQPVVLQDVDDNRGHTLPGDPPILHGRAVQFELHKVPEAEQGGEVDGTRIQSISVSVQDVLHSIMVCNQVQMDVCCLTQGVGVHHEVAALPGFQTLRISGGFVWE